MPATLFINYARADMQYENWLERLRTSGTVRSSLLDAMAQLTALRQHLVFWLNKYDRVFTLNRAMCVLYTGVEDGVPFPPGLDDTVARWLAAHPG